MKPMQIEMELQIKFNREVDLNKDCIVPGGYEMVMNGKQIKFDFNNSNFEVSRFDSSVCIFSLSGVDYDLFPEFEAVTIDDLQNISEIIECFVYVGEPGESDLKVVSVEKIFFLLPSENPNVIDVPQNVISEFNKTLQWEMNMANKFKVKIPNGYLMVEEKGVEDEYPGVLISFSKDGKGSDVDNIIAYVEYDSCSEEIKTSTYKKDFEEPNNIICYEDGRDLV